MQDAFLRFMLFIFAVAFTFSATAQHYSFEPAEKIASLSSSLEESCPLLSPDGQTLYFTRFDPLATGGKLVGSDIWMSRNNGQDQWGEAIPLPKTLNNKKHNVAIGFDQTGRRMYLLNSYIRTQKSDIALVQLKPDNLKPDIAEIPKINQTEGFLGLYVHPSENIILISMIGENNAAQEDLYVMLRDSLGRWSSPQSLGPIINTDGFEISPFLSHDEKTLFFASNGHNGFGDADIFMSQRLYDTWNVWTRPMNLGRNINSEKFDAYFTFDGQSHAYFVSNKDGGLADIYKAKAVLDQADSTAVKIQQLIQDAQRLLKTDKDN